MNFGIREKTARKWSKMTFRKEIASYFKGT
jgi:hypothetical protein